MSCIWPPAGWPSIFHSKNFNVGHNRQTVQPNVYRPAMLICTIDFYYSIPLSLSLTRGHKVSAKQNIVASFSHTLYFRLIRVKF